MVPNWFLGVMYLLIAGTCSLLIPEEVGWLLMRFGQLQLHPALHSNLKRFLALELISFASLFEFGMSLLDYHRFQPGIVLFALGTAVLAVGILLAVFGLQSKMLKLFCVVVVYICAICACKYLMGIVKQGQEEYYSAENEKGEEKSRAFLEKSKPRPSLVQPQPATQSQVSKSAPIPKAPMQRCEEDNLEACTTKELSDRTQALADGIDSVYRDYERHIDDLIAQQHRDENDPSMDAIAQGRADKERKFAANAWDQMALQHYESCCRNDALKYRSVLLGKSLVPGTRDDSLLPKYEKPFTTRFIHEVADDLRRIGATIK